MFFNFKKNDLDSESLYSIRPDYLSGTFIKLLHLLTDEDILLTFEERDDLYKSLYKIIEFLEEKKK